MYFQFAGECNAKQFCLLGTLQAGSVQASHTHRYQNTSVLTVNTIWYSTLELLYEQQLPTWSASSGIFESYRPDDLLFFCFIFLRTIILHTNAMNIFSPWGISTAYLTLPPRKPIFLNLLSFKLMSHLLFTRSYWILSPASINITTLCLFGMWICKSVFSLFLQFLRAWENG